MAHPFELEEPGSRDLVRQCPPVLEREQRILGPVNHERWGGDLSEPLLERLGDIIVTGPTGNNLRDLRVLLAY